MTRATKRTIVRELRELGYAGPVSMSRDKLLSILARERESRTVDTAATPAQPEEGMLEGRARAPWLGNLDREQEFQVKGEVGAWFRFLGHVTSKDGEEWVDCYGGTKHHYSMRSFRPERIRTKPDGTYKSRPCRRAVDTEEEDDA